MALTGFETFSRVLLGWLGRLVTRDSVGLKNQLVKARIPLLPEDYVATSVMQVLIAAIFGILLTLGILGFLIPEVIETMENPNSTEGDMFDVSRTVEIIIAVVLVIFIPFLIGLVQWLSPAFLESSRASNMDRQLPFAASYVSAMAAANATPIQTFKSLARNEDIYGDIAVDSAWIFHSMEFMGRDLVTTLKEAVDRSPSERFAEFLQGIIGTVTSGGNLKLYFLNRSEYYAQQNRVHVKDVLQQMALFSEAYVVVAVALPIFAMIIAVITFWVSGAGMQLEEIHMYLLVFGGFPIIQLIFSGLFYSLSQEVSTD
uniref:Bacterial type II secretion system protein F domain (FlaJ-A, flaJ) n=1 Tax=uncultured marine group II/III euryarchaeote KM3_147_B09 TaxID=1457882 RepID=A0A075GHQ2_9EURY|nr:Bacterial type II secretion system protein F domain (flaJ-A, flaJ) [uncultured marine group II/III euryarchaeote KM3_147_B09]